MSTVPLIPDTAPFSAEQRAWLNGFLAGMFSRGTAPASGQLAAAPAPALIPLTILFGSQTGTAESLAKRAAKEAGRRNFAATVVEMAQTDLIALRREQNVLVIVSTYGEGEPPDTAKALHAELNAAIGEGAASGAMLASLKYSVCALGDTNYVQFCRCGKDFDARLQQLGATRVAERVDCDVDYDEPFSAWLRGALNAFSTGAGVKPGTAANASDTETASVEPRVVVADTPAEPAYSKNHPFPARLLASRKLNAAGSAKQVHHVAFELGPSGLIYEAGDALGVFAQNCPELVQDVLSALGCDGEEAVPSPDGSTTSLRHALTEFYDLGKPTAELAALVNVAWQSIPAGEETAGKPVPASGQPHHVIDVLVSAGGAKLAPMAFVRALKRLQPRLYSISSSPKAHPGEVHLTVGAVRYEKDGRARKGVCSTFVAERAQPGETRVGVFIHANKAFRPPSDGNTPMIMVGPGTGIAPFRGFLHERKATGANGRNWLFFGDQRAATDFIYREELAELMRDGVLTRLDTAFSRDQSEKIYVQQRMLENAAELYAWLEAGAHFYVCGDASRMAKDVDAALHRIVETAGGKTPEQAAAYIQQLRTAKRYARDVY